MTDAFEHLSDPLRQAMPQWMPAERRAYLDQQDLFVNHPLVAAAVDQLLALNPGRIPRLAEISGASGMGKSMLIEAFQRRLVEKNKADPSASTDIIVVEPSWEDEPMQFLHELAAPLMVEQGGRADFFERIVAAMKSRRLAALVIEDLHDLFSIQRRSFGRWLKVLRRIANISNIPIAYTILPEALTKTRSDEQFCRRIMVTIALPLWRKDNDLRVFLAGLERLLPLKSPSNLASPDIARWLLSNAGTTRFLVGAVKSAARQAIGGAERVTLEGLKAAYVPAPHTPRAARDVASRQAAQHQQSKTENDPGGLVP